MNKPQLLSSQRFKIQCVNIVKSIFLCEKIIITILDKLKRSQIRN